MQTFTRTYPDGTKGAYTVAPGSSLPMTLATLKPVKKPALARSAKRQFPSYHPGITSTAEYIEAYFSLNTRPFNRIHAYDNLGHHLGLYQPLPAAPAAVYTGVDSVETIE